MTMPIEVTKIRSGDVMYKVFVDEMRYSREGMVLYVYVPEDVPLEAIDRKATEVYEAWKATLKP